MADNESPKEDVVNVRLTVTLTAVKADAVPGIRVSIKTLLSEWGDVNVTASISDYRKPLTFADMRRGRG